MAKKKVAEVFGRLEGTWKVGVDDSGRAIVYTGIIGVDGWQLVCRPNPIRGSKGATDVANIISAAPDMLTALKALLPLFDEAVDWVPEYTALADDARSAIAKAGGGRVMAEAWMVRGYMTPAEQARADVWEKAKARVDRSPRLRKYKSIILSDGYVDDDHLRWVVDAKVGEIEAWAKQIKEDE